MVNAAPEGTELIRQVKLTLSEAVHRVMQSEITHGPSMTLILKAAYSQAQLAAPSRVMQAFPNLRLDPTG